MIVTCRLNPDLDLNLAASVSDPFDPSHEPRQPRPIQRERERGDQPFPRGVGDQRHRLVLANIHRDQQTPLQREPIDPGRTLRDITTMNMHHDNTSGVSRDG